MLIAMAYNPIFRMIGGQGGNWEEEGRIRKKLTSELVNYIYELINEKRTEYLHYMILIPQ